MWIKCLFFVWSVAAVTAQENGCKKQSNKDITGGKDLRDFRGKPESECCQLCKETSGCKAYAWNDYEGGTCWLKSADVPIVDKIGVSIGIMDGGDQTANVCQKQSNKDIYGQDLRSLSGKPESDCCQLCTETSGCKAYAWTDYEGGTCWLKSADEPIIDKNGCSLGIIAADHQSANVCQKQSNKDIYGQDLRSLSGKPEIDCCQLCTETSGCKAYAWTDYEGGTCWLKSADEPIIDKNGCSLGIIAADHQSANGCQKQSNKDVNGKDLRPVSGKQENDCCQLCKETSGCKAYAWTDYEGGTCWLKSADEPIIDKNGVSLGILAAGRQSGPKPMGICYNPFHHPKYENIATVPDILRDDFATIKSIGFNSIRTYYAEYYGVSVADILNKTGGITAAIGIYMYPEHLDWIESQIKTAVTAAHRYPGIISTIYVGNENVAPVGIFSSDTLIDYIRRIQQRLRENGVINVLVGTVQRYTEWVSGRDDIERLALACDVIGVNVYPFFSQGFDQWNPIPVVESQLRIVKVIFPGKKIEITETGWPSEGSECASDQVRSIDMAQNYFKKIKEWSGNHPNEKVYYYQTFNKKTDQGNDCENYFGILDAFGNPKFDLN